MGESDQLDVRAARMDDEPEIRRCVDSAYAPYVERIGKLPAPMLDDYELVIRRGVVRVVTRVATRTDRIEGLIVMWPREGHLFIDNIAVNVDAQGAGVGAALLAEADREAARLGLEEIRLYTNVMMSENIEYYPRRGFVETHRATDSGYNRVYFSKRLPPKPN